MTSAFFLREDVRFCFEFLVRLDRSGCCQNLAALDFFLFRSAKEATAVIACAAFIEELTEHLDTGDRRTLSRVEADDFDVLTDFDDSALDATSDDGTATRDREHVFDGHQERLVDRALRSRDVTIDFSHELQDRVFSDFGAFAFERHERRTFYDGDLVAGEFVLREELSDLELDEVEEFCVVDHVDFVHEDDHRRNADLTCEQDVLTRLGHRTVCCRNDEDRAVHLSGTRDHVLHIIRVSRAVDVCVVAVRGRVLDVRSRDGDTALFFFRGFVDLVVGHCRRATRFSEDLGDRRS